jgi:hypothetical protein
MTELAEPVGDGSLSKRNFRQSGVAGDAQDGSASLSDSEEETETAGLVGVNNRGLVDGLRMDSKMVWALDACQTSVGVPYKRDWNSP